MSLPNEFTVRARYTPALSIDEEIALEDRGETLEIRTRDFGQKSLVEVLQNHNQLETDYYSAFRQLFGLLEHGAPRSPKYDFELKDVEIVDDSGEVLFTATPHGLCPQETEKGEELIENQTVYLRGGRLNGNWVNEPIDQWGVAAVFDDVHGGWMSYHVAQRGNVQNLGSNSTYSIAFIPADDREQAEAMAEKKQAKLDITRQAELEDLDDWY